MAVSGGYDGALAWMRAHGYTQADLDLFLQDNPRDWARVDTAFAPNPGTAAVAGYATPSVSVNYAQPSTVLAAGATGSITASGDASGDSRIAGSGTLPAFGRDAIASRAPISGAASLPATTGSGIPMWAWLLGAAALVLVLVNRK